MPTYEYICTECKNAWEEIQKISEPPVEVCPKCGKPSAKRQISGGNFILKGGGWYSDLYSSTPKSSGKESASSGEAKSEAKADTKTDSAPKADAPKAESKGDGGSKTAA